MEPASDPKRRKVMGEATTTTTTTTKRSSSGTSAPAARSPPAPSPPDPRRYVALWTRYGKGGIELPNRPVVERDHAAAATAADAAASVAANPAAAPQRAPSIVGLWEQELELARYNEHMLGKMARCRAKIGEHRRHIEALEQEVADIQWELDRATVLPRLYRRDHHDENEDHDDDDADAFWNEAVPSEVRYDKDLARRMLRPCDRFNSTFPEDREVPIPYLKMLWMEPDCPLREDRDILLASLDKGLDSEITIAWSDQMKNDRELVKACFAKEPDCLRFEDDDDDDDNSNNRGSGLPSRYLNDMEMLRAFAFSKRRFYRRPKFSPALLHDPEFLSDLIVHQCTDKSSGWEKDLIKDAFPPGGQPARQPLLDSAEFALRLADGMMGVPVSDRRRCPVTYKMLSPRLQETLEVAMAYLRLDGCNIAHVPPALRSNEELWRVAARSYPGIVYYPWFDPTLCPNLCASKELALLLVEQVKSDPWNYRRGECFAKYFPTFSPEIRNDREVNVQLVLPNAGRKSTELDNHLAPAWAHNRDFWIDLAVSHACPCSLWSIVPAAMAEEAPVMLAWARHARPTADEIEWIADASTKRPALGLLSDRQVLLNWLPVASSDTRRGGPLFRRVSPEILDDKSLWLELLSKGDGRDYLPYMPEPLLQDFDIVDAQLRTSGLFPKSFIMLPVETQLRFQHLLVERMDECGGWTSHLSPELLCIPDVARAAISKGWGPVDRRFSDILKSSPWSKDPAFLLSVANATSKKRDGYFWECCTKGLLCDEDLLSKVLASHQGGATPKHLDNDFYVRCISALQHADRFCISLLEYKAGIAREVRKRFAVYVALETFMEGVNANLANRFERLDRAPSSPVVLLCQDGYTREALKLRLKEYLGAPSDAQFVLIRKVCDVFTRNGY